MIQNQLQLGNLNLFHVPQNLKKLSLRLSGAARPCFVY